MSGPGNKGLVWPYSQTGKAEAPAPAGTGVWQRSDGNKALADQQLEVIRGLPDEATLTVVDCHI